MDSSINQEEILKNYVKEQETYPTPGSGMETKGSQSIGPKITSVPGTKPWERSMPLGNQIGWIPVKLEDLPTRGLFYPMGTNLAIRAANGGEIRHWSTLDETDISALDDMLNYVIERCVTLKDDSPVAAYLSWKDIKEIDRLYLLLAIQELTFPEGENKLEIKISDTKRLTVKKDMVNYISLDPAIMKYYNDADRCFVFKQKNGNVIKLDIPSIGVTQWLKSYIIRKQQMQEYIDEDYLNYAPFLIRSWKGLNDDLYNSYVEESHKKWTVPIISILVKFKQIFKDTIDPVIKYMDEGGVERSAPLNFQGGIKSIFLISDPFGELE